MQVIPMQQAKTHLSRLVKQAEQGETIYIGAFGHVQAVLVSPTTLDANKVRPRKQIGLLAGKLHIPEDFDAPLPDDVLADFEGDL